MTPETVIHVGQQALYVASMIIAVVLLPTLGVGLLISMFQAATQINEQTLSFIPKLFVVIAVLFIAGHWILRTLIEYITQLFNDIPTLIG
ncbi:MAG: flagellar biosynthesis protein FliQ [Chromatiales bacterium]|jgi:flagellar biosynthetic protein FliQ|nr:flagellar biosynthesis protein FliQ [Chromatiales bacterium]